MSKHALIESAERLLTLMMDEAVAGEAVVVNPETQEKRVIPAVPFTERMRLIGVATSFLEARNKLAPEGGDEPSQFERDTASAVSTKAKRRAGRKKAKGEEISESIEFPEAEGGFVFDPLADTPDGKYLTSTPSGSTTDLEQAGIAGSAD